MGNLKGPFWPLETVSPSSSYQRNSDDLIPGFQSLGISHTHFVSSPASFPSYPLDSTFSCGSHL